jgi:hypothetical protein
VDFWLGDKGGADLWIVDDPSRGVREVRIRLGKSWIISPDNDPFRRKRRSVTQECISSSPDSDSQNVTPAFTDTLRGTTPSSGSSRTAMPGACPGPP